MAIVFDASGSSTNGHAHTCSGVDRILFVGMAGYTSSTDGVASVKYGGSEMERAALVAGNNLESELWYMVSPTSGENDIVITGGADTKSVVSASYTGVDSVTPFQSSVYSSGTQTDTSAGGTYSSNDAIAHSPTELIISYGAVNHTNAATWNLSTNTTSRVSKVDTGTWWIASEFVDVNSSPSTGVHTFLDVNADNRIAVNIAVVLRPATAGQRRAVKYFHDIYDPGGRIFDELGRVVAPWELKPNNWIKVTGVFLPTSKEYSTFVQDPSIAYIEEVTFSARGGLRIKTNRGEMTDVLLARAAGGKTL